MTNDPHLGVLVVIVGGTRREGGGGRLSLWRGRPGQLHPRPGVHLVVAPLEGTHVAAGVRVGLVHGRHLDLVRCPVERHVTALAEDDDVTELLSQRTLFVSRRCHVV